MALQLQPKRFPSVHIKLGRVQVGIHLCGAGHDAAGSATWLCLCLQLNGCVSIGKQCDISIALCRDACGLQRIAGRVSTCDGLAFCSAVWTLRCCVLSPSNMASRATAAFFGWYIHKSCRQLSTGSVLQLQHSTVRCMLCCHSTYAPAAGTCLAWYPRYWLMGSFAWHGHSCRCEHKRELQSLMVTHVDWTYQ